jgi:1-acyl-sn-glycerol-3-phosphate acyltransferase
MQYPLTADQSAETKALAPKLRRYLLAIGRMLCVAALICATRGQPIRNTAPTARRALLARRTTLLFSILNIRVEFEGFRYAHHPPALVVSNHISWLDALAIQRYFGCNFVVKSEVFSWPIIGALCKAAQCISVKRDSAFGFVHTLSEVNSALSKNTSVGIFPEGTTSCGDTVLPFSHGTFQAAIASQVPVQPILIAYCNSEHSQSYAFIDDDSFLISLWRICLTRSTVMTIRCLPPLAPTGSRRQLCASAYATILSAHNRHKAVTNGWHDSGMEY